MAEGRQAAERPVTPLGRVGRWQTVELVRPQHVGFHGEGDAGRAEGRRSAGDDKAAATTGGAREHRLEDE